MDGSAEVVDGRQVAHEVHVAVSFEEPVLDEEEDTGDACEGEGTVGDEREGGVHFRPEAWAVAAGGMGWQVPEQGGELQNEGEGCGEGAEQGEPVGGACDEVEQNHGPAYEGEQFEGGGDGAASQGAAAPCEEEALAEESGE